MKRVLYLISSIQGKESYSTKLGNAIVERVLEKYPGSTVEEVNLAEQDIPHLNPAILRSFFTPGDQLTAEDKASIHYSNEAVQQLLAADIIVMGAPLYNFTIHTALKAWIDHITRAGLTFGYNENGPYGLLKDKQVYVAVSSGAVYSEGPWQGADFVAPYLKTMLGFLGMTDVTVFRAEGVKVTGVKEQALEKGIASIAIH